MEIQNNSSNYKYFNSLKCELTQTGFDYINVESISKSNFENHVKNISQGADRPDSYNAIIKNILPIPPFSRWEYKNQNFSFVNRNTTPYIPNINNLADFVDLIKKKTKYLKGKRIAIELSGGLDSSIIIELFNLCELDIILIGLVSEKYEFRTERIIQEKYANKYPSILISSEDALPFANLLDCPPHPLPTKKSLFHYQKSTIARKCAEEKVDYLFNGVLGDTVFCEKIDSQRWESWEFDTTWFNEFIFKPNKVPYITTNFNFVLNYFHNQRKEKEADPFKFWARNHFRYFLPMELTEHYYKTDHFEEILQGIFTSEIAINELYKFTNYVTNNNLFTCQKLGYDLNKIKQMNSQEIDLLFAKYSYALWIYSLRNIFDL
jgi:hypothetical protein